MSSSEHQHSGASPNRSTQGGRRATESALRTDCFEIPIDKNPAKLKSDRPRSAMPQHSNHIQQLRHAQRSERTNQSMEHPSQHPSQHRTQAPLRSEHPTQPPGRSAVLDAVRLLAILLVILVHASELIYTVQTNVLELPRLEQLSFTILFTLGRIGVILFIFLTAYLLLPRQYDARRINRHYGHTIPKLYLYTVMGITLLTGYDYYKGIPFDLTLYLKRLLFIAPFPGVQVWYMPFVIALYLFIPILANGLRTLPNKAIALVTSIGLIYFFIVPDFTRLRLMQGSNTIESQVLFPFFGFFGVYVLTGYLIRRGTLRRIPTLTILSVTLLSFAGLVYFQLYSYHTEFFYLAWYDSTLLWLTTTGLFEIMTRPTRIHRQSKLLTYAAKATFGMYWIHSMTQEILLPYIPSSSRTIQTLLLTLANFAITLTIISVLNAAIALIRPKSKTTNPIQNQTQTRTRSQKRGRR